VLRHLALQKGSKVFKKLRPRIMWLRCDLWCLCYRNVYVTLTVTLL